MRTLQDLFLDELADMYDAERRLAKAVPRFAKVATDEELRGLLLSHLEETHGHAECIEEVFGCFDLKARARPCGATIGILEEGDELVEDYKDSPAINAALICLVQKIESHEIAQYTCLQEWAVALGNKRAASLLKEILTEEKAASKALSELARESSKKEALGNGLKPLKMKTAVKTAALSITAFPPSGLRGKNAPTLA